LPHILTQQLLPVSPPPQHPICLGALLACMFATVGEAGSMHDHLLKDALGSHVMLLCALG
jgi:hypothetical protein